jgi:hypothetical protein
MKNNFFMLTVFIALLSNVSLFAKNLAENNKLQAPKDSIIINFGNNSRIVVYVANATDKEKLKTMDINALLQKVEYRISKLDGNPDNVTIEENGMKMQVYRQNNENRIIVADTTKKKTIFDFDWSCNDNKNKSYPMISSYFDVDFGLNTYIGNVSSNNLYELSPIGSRYIALGTGIKYRLQKEKKLYLNAGVEFAWNNFMFENNNVRVLKDDNQTYFSPSLTTQEKSKLVAAYMNIPIMLSYKSMKTGLGIAVGGYVGYRLDSYNAFIESGKDKQQAHSSFYMNTVRHGLRVAIDVKYLTLFCNYDTSNLFQSGKAPDLQVISFGIKLLGGSL